MKTNNYKNCSLIDEYYEKSHNMTIIKRIILKQPIKWLINFSIFYLFFKTGA